jgi:hypothetical protein
MFLPSALSREPFHRLVVAGGIAEPTWLLIDETQDNGRELFNLLLKNVQNAITGAGVPEFQSMSQKFKKKFGNEHLFLLHRVMVDEELCTSSGLPPQPTELEL